MGPKLSVIIPVYNAENYLGDCINSILNQSFQDFELILVNDGSTDNSLRICNQYKELDRRVKLFDKPNGGVSTARNRGIKEATGEWIYFVDADDIIDSHLFDIFKTINFDDIDIIQFGYKLIDMGGEITLRKNNSAKYYNLNEFESDVKNKYFSLWIHFVRRDVIKRYKIQFIENVKYGEDITFMIQCFLSSNGIQVFDFCGYNYFVRENSAMSKAYNFNNAKTHLQLASYIINFYEINNFYYDLFVKNRIIYMINSYFSFIMRSKEKISPALINKSFIEFKNVNKRGVFDNILKTGRFRILSLSPTLYLYLMKFKNKLS